MGIMKFEISKGDLEAIGSYLARRPWVEVQQLMTTVQKIANNPLLTDGPAPDLGADKKD